MSEVYPHHHCTNIIYSRTHYYLYPHSFITELKQCRTTKIIQQQVDSSLSSPDRPLTTVPRRLEYSQRLKRHQVVEGGIRDVWDVVVVEEEILEGGKVGEGRLLDGHHLVVAQLAATDGQWSTQWTMVNTVDDGQHSGRCSFLMLLLMLLSPIRDPFKEIIHAYLFIYLS